MIFARSNRSTYMQAAVALVVATALGGAAAWLAWRADLWTALVAGMLATVAVAFAGRAARRLWRWPASRLGLFRDRMVVIQGCVELQALWEEVDTATLVAQGEVGTITWPELKLSDRLTVRLRSGRYFGFRPRVFGLQAVACRDLVLRLRDEEGLRGRLPEFDSVLDLATRPVSSGELIRPQL